MLAVGTELGAETTGQYRLAFGGRLIHLDAAPERIGATYPALALVGDARATLGALLDRVPARATPTGPPAPPPCARASRAGSTAQGRDLERGLLADLATRRRTPTRSWPGT